MCDASFRTFSILFFNRRPWLEAAARLQKHYFFVFEDGTTSHTDIWRPTVDLLWFKMSCQDEEEDEKDGWTEVINLQNHAQLKSQQNSQHFWSLEDPENYKNIHQAALNKSALFGSVLQTFVKQLLLAWMQSKYRTRLTDEHVHDSIRVNLSGYTSAYTWWTPCSASPLTDCNKEWMHLFDHKCHKMLVRWWLRTCMWILSEVLTMWAIIICETFSFSWTLMWS